MVEEDLSEEIIFKQDQLIEAGRKYIKYLERYIKKLEGKICPFEHKTKLGINEGYV